MSVSDLSPTLLEGRTFRPEQAEELFQAIEVAFDYRGDVTLELRSGERVEGYLFNRSPTAVPPFVQVYLQGQPGPRRIPYGEIAAIAFTGEDPASGKSWEAWIKKKASDRKAEADRLAAQARARGHL